MAVLAVVAAVDMRWVFAGRRHAIMTGTAGAEYLRVIDGKYRGPDVGRVAVLADVAGLYVCRSLARRLDAVVAARAVARDVDVVEVGRQPGDRRMAVVAIVAAGNVGRVLASGRDTVVA